MKNKTDEFEKTLKKSAEAEAKNKAKEVEELEKNPPETEIIHELTENTEDNTSVNTNRTKKVLSVVLTGVAILGGWYIFKQNKGVNV